MGKKLTNQLNTASFEVLNPNLLSNPSFQVLGGGGSAATQSNSTGTVITPVTDPATTVVTTSNNAGTSTTTSTATGTSTGSTGATTTTTTPTAGTTSTGTTTAENPFYKQWWFWAVSAGVIAIAAYFYFTKIKK